jgi:hypothetical protein
VTTGRGRRPWSKQDDIKKPWLLPATDMLKDDNEKFLLFSVAL